MNRLPNSHCESNKTSYESNKTALALLSVFFFFGSFLAFSDFGITTIVLTPIVIFLVAYVGLFFWMLILKANRKITIIEATGIGLALGLLICLAVYFVFELFGIGLTAVYLMMAITLLPLAFPKTRKLLQVSRINFQVRDTSMLNFIIFLALAPSRPELLLPVIILGLIAITNFESYYMSENLTAYCKFASTCLVTSVTFFWLNISNPGPSNYLFSAGGESIPRESWANSVLGWGPFENIALFGNPLRYHWLSFAASGLITRLAKLEPLALSSSGLLGMLDAVIVGSTVWACIFLLKQCRTHALTGILILYGTVSLSEPFHLLSDSSPDATTWLVWFALFLFFIISFEKNEIRYPVLIIPLVACSVILSNGAYGASLFIGMTGWYMGNTLGTKWKVKSIFTTPFWISILTLTSMTTTYIIFLTPSSYSTKIIDFSTSFITSYFGLSVALTLFFARAFSVFYLRCFPSNRMRGFGGGLLIGATFAFFTYRNSTGSLSPQFVMPLMVTAAVIGPFVVVHSLKAMSASSVLNKFAVGTFVWIGFILQISFNYFERRASNRFPTILFNKHILLIYLLVLIVTISVFAPTVFLRNRKFGKSILKFSSLISIVSVIAFHASGIGIAAGYSIRSQVRDFAENRNGRLVVRTNEPQFTRDFFNSMDWLRENSKFDDLVGTNFLSGTTPEDFNTDSKYPNSRFGISAISQRRVLIEGAAWAHVGIVFPRTIDQPTWLVQRITMSHRFASRPDEIAVDYMKKMEINWFVVDKTKQMPNSWSPYATIAYENSEVIILKTTF
jgi:hypothetical protein